MGIARLLKDNQDKLQFIMVMRTLRNLRESIRCKPITEEQYEKCMLELHHVEHELKHNINTHRRENRRKKE